MLRCELKKVNPVLKSIGSKRRAGFNLIEILIALIIISIVMLGFGASASLQVKRTNRETVANELQVLASNFSDAYYDLGSPEIDSSAEGSQDDFERFLKLISTDYLNYTFDLDSIEPMSNGFSVKVADPIDVYEQEYNAWFITMGTSRYVVVASGGDDGVINYEGYKNQDYADDIVMVVRPKL